MKISRTFLRSALTSLFTTGLDFLTLVTAVEVFGVDYVLATWLGTVVGSLSNFTINRSWAFRGSAVKLRWQLLRFLGVQIGASTLHTLGVWLLVRFGGLSYQIAKLVVATVVAVAWNYPLNRAVVFARRITPAPAAAPSQSSASPGP
jgi:putative flippase GtrA